MNAKNPDRRQKADRLKYIVNRMRQRIDITPAMLAEELRVSERTVYRDLSSLEQGQSLAKRYSRSEGRYLLEQELMLPMLSLTPSEALALYAAAANPALKDDNFLASDLRSGLTKLSRALIPDGDGHSPPATLSIAPFSMTRESIERPIMERLRRAMRTHRKIKVRYWACTDNIEHTLLIAPYELFEKEKLWYLLGHSEEAGGVRLFLIHCMRGAEVTTERFRYPRRYSADELKSTAVEPYGGDLCIDVRICFDPEVVHLVVESRGQQFSKMEALPDGSLICTATVANPKELLWWVMSYGHHAEVLSPPEVRSAFSQVAHAMAAAYDQPPR
jgi:predicted DNA-binding transcriptional regulator YafY